MFASETEIAKLANADKSCGFTEPAGAFQRYLSTFAAYSSSNRSDSSSGLVGNNSAN